MPSHAGAHARAHRALIDLTEKPQQAALPSTPVRQSTVRLVVALGLLLALAVATHAVGPGPDPTPMTHHARSTTPAGT